MRYVRSVVVLVAAMIGGSATGLGVTAALRSMSCNGRLSTRLGVGAGLFLCLAILGYGSLWEEIVRRAQPIWKVPPRNAKAESKLRTAESRGAFVFGIVGYCMLVETGCPNVIVVVVVTCCAGLGAVLGYDIRRRVRRIRQQAPSPEAGGDN